VKKYQFTPDQWETLDYIAWSKESLQIVKDSVYAGIKENQPLPDFYVTKNQDVI
jgi:hypothetical protein